MHGELRMVRRGRRGELALRIRDAADASARPPRRDRCRAPAEPPRHAAGSPRHAGTSPSPASSRSSPPRSPGRHDARGGAPPPPRSGGRAAPPVRSARFPRDAPARSGARSQELQRVLPILVEMVRHQSVERLPADAARHHVVHQPREVAGQRQRRGRTADHQRRQHRALGPGRDQTAPASAGVRVRRASAECRGRRAARAARPPRQRPARPRRCRQARRCAAGSPHPPAARRERSPAPSARRAGSADRASPAPAVSGSHAPRSRRPAGRRPARR